MTSATTALVTEAEPTIRHALSALVEVLEAPNTAPDDRAAAFVACYGLRRYLHRPLNGPARVILTEHMQREGIRRMGRLVLSSRAIDPRWPANDPANWADATLQDAMAGLRTDPAMRPYIREVPHHLEIDQLALAIAVIEAVPGAQQLYREAKAKGWRTEAARQPQLVVR